MGSFEVLMPPPAPPSGHRVTTAGPQVGPQQAPRRWALSWQVPGEGACMNPTSTHGQHSHGLFPSGPWLPQHLLEALGRPRPGAPVLTGEVGFTRAPLHPELLPS